MKKMISLLLVFMMLLSACSAFADGAETSKAITFMNYEFGDTFKNIRGSTRLFCIDFLYGKQNARVVSDALYDFAERDEFTQKRKLPSCFFARTSETFKVAGYDVGTMLWFVYPFQDGLFCFDEDAGIFYAGVYEFHAWDDLVSICADLKSKLTTLYGEPFFAGDSLNSPLGRLPFTASIMQWYNSDVAKFKPEYVMWKSSANDAILVLSFWYDTNLKEHKLKLAYVSDYAEAHFDHMEKLGVFGEINYDVVDYSMQGL